MSAPNTFRSQGTVACFGCDHEMSVERTDMYDGERYCADCLKAVEQ